MDGSTINKKNDYRAVLLLFYFKLIKSYFCFLPVINILCNVNSQFSLFWEDRKEAINGSTMLKIKPLSICINVCFLVPIHNLTIVYV